MGTTAQKLEYLNTTKTKIKESINLTNANITNEPFRQYAVILKNQIPELIGDPSPIWNNYEHVTGSGTTFSINAYNSIFNYSILGNTVQNGTPTPDAPIPINVVSGNNSININSNAYPINLGITNLYNKYGDFNYPTTGWINGTSLQPDGTIKTVANFSNTASRGIELTLEKNTVYSVSGILISSTGDQNTKAVVRIMGYSASWSAITNYYVTNLGYFSFTFNSGNNNEWFLSLSSNGTAGQSFQAIFNNIQVEKGSNANSYTDYYTIPIELCKIDTYQDRIYKSNGKWYLHKEIGKYIFNGSENWNYYTDTNKPVFYLIANDYKINYLQKGNLICYSNYYQGKGEANLFDDVYDYGNNVIALRSSFLRIVVRDDSMSNTTNFKTWLSSHNVVLYYVLATPTNTEITDYQLIYQLEQVKLANGTNNVITSGNDLSATVSIEAIKYLK